MVTYATLDTNYGMSAPQGFREFTKKHGVAVPNTCAVRLSYALFLSDKSFFGDISAPAGHEWYGLPTHANDLAVILNKMFKNGKLIHSKTEIAGKTGIIFFDTITSFGGTGHISLWDGSAVADGIEPFDRSPRIYFWDI